MEPKSTLFKHTQNTQEHVRSQYLSCAAYAQSASLSSLTFCARSQSSRKWKVCSANSRGLRTCVRCASRAVQTGAIACTRRTLASTWSVEVLWQGAGQRKRGETPPGKDGVHTGKAGGPIPSHLNLSRGAGSRVKRHVGPHVAAPGIFWPWLSSRS